MRLGPSIDSELVTVAHHIRAAARAGDQEALHTDLCRLRNALSDHLRAALGQCSPSDNMLQQVAADRHRHLLDLVDEILRGRGSSRCNCVVRAAELEAAVLRQARFEALTQAGCVGAPSEFCT